MTWRYRVQGVVLVLLILVAIAIAAGATWTDASSTTSGTDLFTDWSF